MLYGQPIFREHLEFDPLYSDKKPITVATAAEVAILQRGSTELEAIRRGNAILKECNTSDFAYLVRVFNASGDRVWLRKVERSTGKVWKYPLDYYIDNGQWSLFLLTCSEDTPKWDIAISYEVDAAKKVNPTVKFSLRYAGGNIELTSDGSVNDEGRHNRVQKGGYAATQMIAMQGKSSVVDLLISREEIFQLKVR